MCVCVCVRMYEHSVCLDFSWQFMDLCVCAVWLCVSSSCVYTLVCPGLFVTVCVCFVSTQPAVAPNNKTTQREKEGGVRRE